MRWITGLVRGIWNLSSNSRIDVGQGLRPGSRASAFYLFLLLIFFLVGLVLVLFGFKLGDVDRWLDAQSGWLDIAGTLLFKALFAFILFLCVLTLGVGLFTRLPRRRRPRDSGEPTKCLGFGAMAAALVIGYFAYIGLVSKL
jgi:hypothetical protein